MRSFVALAIFIAFIFACATTNKTAPSAVGFVTLRNYLLNPDSSFHDDVHYTFIGNAEAFHKMFYMTKVSAATAVIPDFASQSVVAIILKPTEKVVSVAINKAEIAGDKLNIYYTITDTTSWKTYSQTAMVVAIVPKSVNVKQVSFHRGNIKEKTISANY